MLFASIPSTLSARNDFQAGYKFESWRFVLIIDYSCWGMARLLFHGFGKARIIFLPALNIISNANSVAVQNKLTFFLLARIIFNFLFRWTQPDARWPLLA